MSYFIEKYDDIKRIYISYTLYSKEEIRTEWPDFKLTHFANMRNKQHYVTCTVKCEDEALVLIALLIRRMEKKPCNFYYDEKSKKLLAFCPKDVDNKQTIREVYESVIEMFLGDKDLEYMDRDPVGKKLFSDGELDHGEVKTTSPSISPVPFSGNIHEHLCGMNDNGVVPAMFGF